MIVLAHLPGEHRPGSKRIGSHMPAHALSPLAVELAAALATIAVAQNIVAGMVAQEHMVWAGRSDRKKRLQPVALALRLRA